jgi:hypothetical protein
VDEESKSCFNVSLHVDLDLNENVENANGLVGLHMSRSFFTMGDIDQRENSFSEEIYVSSHHSIPPFLPCDEKETSCVVNSSSYFSVVDQEEGFPIDNGTLWVTLMVMSGSHYPISSFPSQGMEEEAMGKDTNVDHFVNEENIDTHDMNPSSPMDNLELIYFDLNCPVVINSPSSTDIDQECFPTVDGLVIEPSCSKNSCDFLLSSNHEYVLEDISDSHIVQEKNNHVDLFTQGEEINIQDIPLLSQQSTFFLEEENHVEEERVDCETIPSVEPTNSQSVTNVLKEEEIPFRESLFENVSCSREDFNSLNSSTYYYLYLDLFNGLILQEATHCPIQINSIGMTPFEVLDGGNVHMEDREDKASSHELSTTMPYQPFSWDEGNVVENVYQTMSSSFSSSFFISRDLLVQVAL